MMTRDFHSSDINPQGRDGRQVMRQDFHLSDTHLQ